MRKIQIAVAVLALMAAAGVASSSTLHSFSGPGSDPIPPCPFKKACVVK